MRKIICSILLLMMMISFSFSSAYAEDSSVHQNKKHATIKFSDDKNLMQKKFQTVQDTLKSTKVKQPAKKKTKKKSVAIKVNEKAQVIAPVIHLENTDEDESGTTIIAPVDRCDDPPPVIVTDTLNRDSTNVPPKKN